MRLRVRSFLAAWAVALSGITPAHAHRFAEPYDLPVPLWLYLTGAGAAVLLSFVLMAAFGFATRPAAEYPRFDLLRTPVGLLLAGRATRFVIRLAAVALFAVVVTAGFIGNQDPTANALPPTVWVFWWVGLAYVSALIGDAWRLLNPWNALFAGAEWIARRLHPGAALSLGLPYPRRLGAWPAVILFFGFAWMELVWPQGQTPAALAQAAVIYSAVTFAGMVLFGRETWLRNGEAFSILFGLFARFAPTEIRVRGAQACTGCGAVDCPPRRGDCVGCYECFDRADPKQREWNLRPYGVGLAPRTPVSTSIMLFVLVVLATVSFDGLKETGLRSTVVNSAFFLPGARTFMPWLAWLSGDVVVGIMTAVMIGFTLLIAGSFLVIAWLVATFTGIESRRRRTGALETARWFALTLMPIALAYHLAHYLTYFLIYVQLAVPLLSDPFGFGWDLFGTAGYRVDIGIIDARLAWYTAVAAIVIGHIIAVYLAHATALRLYGDVRVALRSQYPMVAAMIGYTMLSLWILAQPIVAGG